VKVLLFGASGMIGSGVLLECLDSPDVSSVVSVGRRSSSVVHPKLTEIVRSDLFDVGPMASSFEGVDACFFCLGITSVGMTEEAYRRITYDLTMGVAKALLAASPRAVFVFVSGVGTDSSEAGRLMWARIKGKTENALLAMGFRDAYMFRPGFVQPLRGARSRTAWIQAAYAITRPIVPLLARVSPNLVLTTVAMGQAMIRVAMNGYTKKILEPADINRAAAGASPASSR
jgi:uncharacterized protein YbjT (DUF2867 family)